MQRTQRKGRTLVDDTQLGPPLGLCLSRTSPIATSWCSAGCQPRDGVLPVRIPLFLPVSVSVWWDKGVLEHFTSSYYTSSLVYLMQESSFMSLVQDVPDFQLPTELAQRETGGRSTGIGSKRVPTATAKGTFSRLILSNYRHNLESCCW